MQYLDFDLAIERQGDKYRARVTGSPAGEASAAFAMPFNDLELENFFLRMGQVRQSRPVRKAGSPETQAAREFGGRLFDATFVGDVRVCFRSSLDEAARQNAGLRLRVHLANAPELGDLPWEYLYNQSLNRFVSLSVESPVVRYLELPERIRPLAVAPPLKILVLISSPTDFDALDVDREWTNLSGAIDHLKQRGRVVLERLEKPTLAALQQRLWSGECNILHYIGHGAFDERAQDGVLLLEDENQRGRRISGNDLGTILHDHRSLRLVILNSCEGGRTSRTDPFAGTAQSLVQQGIPAVIGMQFEITDQAAITFASSFYGALANDFPVDAALSEARKGIFASGNDIEWGTPVLYMRAADGRIFDVRRPGAQEPTPGPTVMGEEDDIAQVYLHGLDSFKASRWQEALDCLTRVQQIKAGFRDVDDLVTKARREIDKQKAEEERSAHIADLLRSAQEFEAREDWSAAIQDYQTIQRLDPFEPTSKAKLANAQKQRTLAILYGEAQQYIDAKRWREATDRLRTLKDMQDGYRDVNTLMQTAQRELSRQEAEAQRQTTINTLVGEARTAMSGENWTTAIEKWRAVLKLEPVYAEALAGLQKSQQMEGPAALYAAGLQYYDAKKWREALDNFKRVQEILGSYKDVDRLIVRVERLMESQAGEEQKRAHIISLAREAQSAEAREDWQSALDKWQAILALDPGQVEAAKGLSRCKQQLNVANLYSRGRQNYDAHRWQDALNDLRQVRSLQPRYKDVDALITNSQNALNQIARPQAAVRQGGSRLGSLRLLVMGVVVGVVLVLGVCCVGLVLLSNQGNNSTTQQPVGTVCYVNNNSGWCPSPPLPPGSYCTCTDPITGAVYNGHVGR